MRELRQDWRDIFCGFRVALDVKKMYLGFAGIVLSLVFLLVLVRIGEAAGMLQTVTSAKLCQLMFRNPPSGWARLAQLGRDSLAVVDGKECVFLAVAGLGLAAIWGVFAGAICRIAAVEVARDERITMGEALAFSRSKVLSYVFSPVVPLLVILVLVICNNLGGLAGRIPLIGSFFVALTGIGFPLALLAGFLITLLAIGAVFGFPLMFPTISSEGTDAFDAISRAFSYVYSRPWRYIFYHIVAAVYGAVICTFVVVFAVFALQVAMDTVHCGMGETLFGNPRVLTENAYWLSGSQASADATIGQLQSLDAQVGGVQRWLLGWMKLWVGVLVAGPVLGFLASYRFTANSIIYLLMRKAVDGTDMTEVYVEEEEEDFAVPPAAPPTPAPAEPAAPAVEPAPAPVPKRKRTTKKKAKRTAKKAARKKATRKKATTKKTVKKKTRKKKTT